MRRHSLLIAVVLTVLVAFAMGSVVLAGETNKDQTSQTTNAPSTQKACPKVCKDKASCTATKATCTKTCTSTDCKGKAQCTDACKAECTKHQSSQCKPADCKMTQCKGTPGK